MQVGSIVKGRQRLSQDERKRHEKLLALGKEDTVKEVGYKLSGTNVPSGAP